MIRLVEFVAYIANPYSPSDPVYCSHLKDDGKSEQISLASISACKRPIFSYKLPLLIDCLKERKLPLPKCLIDIEHAGRLLIGLSESEFTTQPQWEIWELLKGYISNKTLSEKVRKWYYRSTELPNDEDIIKTLNQLCCELKRLWEKIYLKLISEKELNRFESIEIPINYILLDRQYNGIRIDSKKFNRRLNSLDKLIVISSEKLRSTWGILDISNVKQLQDSLKYAGFTELADILTASNIEKIADISAEWVEILKLYKLIKNAKRDKKILLRFGAIGRERIYPQFESQGTVTGRILVKTPLIQNLKKSNRDIIIPDEGYILLYPDFSQFEPGILADDSKDDMLCKIYNSGDVYKALSMVLFNSEEFRKTAKSLFLAFSYGMTKDKMSHLISGFTKSDKKASLNLLNSFFGKFDKIDEWKRLLYKELSKTGRIGTREGNYRYRKSNNKRELTYKEQRWVISQRVQGTASVILKRCILRINKELPDAQFLVPMHDAVLYQVPIKKEKKYRRYIGEIFIDEFQKECKSILPRVTFNSFVEND